MGHGKFCSTKNFCFCETTPKPNLMLKINISSYPEVIFRSLVATMHDFKQLKLFYENQEDL